MANRCVALPLLLLAVGGGFTLYSTGAFCQKESKGKAGNKAGAKGEKKSDANLKEAKVHFKKGTAFYEDGEYQAALAEFILANEIQSHYMTLYNIAGTYARLNRPVEAIEKYKECLASGEEEIDGKLKKTIQKEIERLSLLVATVHVAVNVEGATVLVDGKEVATIKGKEGSIQVSAGLHEIKVTRKGFSVARNELTLSGGTSSKLNVELESEAYLKVDSKVKGAAVLLNGAKKGTIPFEESLPPGSYTLEVEEKGYLPLKEELTVDPGKHVSVTARMLKPSQQLNQAYFWTAAGVTVVFGIAAIAYGAKALDAQDEYDGIVSTIHGDPPPPDLAELQEQGRALIGEIDAHALKCDVFLGVAAAGAVAALVLGFFTSFKRKPESKGIIQVSISDGLSMTW